MATRKKRTKRKKKAQKGSKGKPHDKHSVFAGKGNPQYGSTTPVVNRFAHRTYQ